MHSRIIGIVQKTNDEDYEREKEAVLSTAECEVYDQMGQVPDYVIESENIKEDFDWFLAGKEYLEKTGDYTFKINKDKLEEFLKNKIEKIRSEVYSWGSIKQMIQSEYKLSSLIKDEFEFYVLFGYYTMPLDEFLNDIYLSNNYDIEYEVVKTFDYHF